MDDTEARRARNREQMRRWRAVNREKHQADVRAWALANPEKKRERDRRAQLKLSAKLKVAREARLLETADDRAAAKILTEERGRANRRACYLANREKHLAKSKAWREANPGKSAILQKAWREKNPEKRLANKRTRKASKRIALVGDLTKLQRGRCAYCRKKLGVEVHIDHVMPLKLGGPDQRSNLQLTCAPCNMTKSAQHPVEFAQSLGRLL